MKEIVINDLTLHYPDDFTVLGEEETAQMKFYHDSQGIAIRNDQEHMMVTVGSQEIGGVANLLLSVKDLARKTQEDIARAMRPYGFALSDRLSENAGGKDLDGFAYTYEAEGIRMYGEAYVTKKDKVAYYLYLYAREENKESCQRIWNKMLEKLQWQK